MDQDNYTPSQEPNEASTDTGLEHVYPPRRVIGDRGAGWIMEAWDLYKTAWLQWLVLTLIGASLFLVVLLIPGLELVNSVFSFVWLGGLLLACEANYRGQPVKATLLFAGFRQHLGKLVGLCLLMLLAMFVIFALVMGKYAPMLNQMQQELAQSATPDPDKVMQLLQNVDLQSLAVRILILLAIYLPLYAALWFAPALIVFGNLSIKAALIFSFQASMKNWWPFLIYSFLLLILTVLLPFTLYLGGFILFPVVQLSIYLSFRDIFLQPPTQEQP